MAKKTYNGLDMKGRLFSYNLETKEHEEKGEGIIGSVTLEVDEKGTTVELRLMPQYPVFNSGKPNKTHGILEDMMAGNYNTVVDNGDDADWFSMTGSIDVSYFLPKNARVDDDLARAQKCRLGFINPNQKKEYCNKWKLDTLITDVKDIEADVEKELPRYVQVSGYLIDSYRERLMEVVFQARSENAMNYILSLPVSDEAPHYVSTWGEIMRIERTVVNKNAFGEDEETKYNSSAWVITGMNPNAYMVGDESGITLEDYANLKNELNAHKEEQKNGEDAISDAPGSGNLAF